MSKPVVAFAWFAAGLMAFAAATTRGFASAPALASNAAVTSLGLVAWAFAGATLSGAPLGQRLGWVPSRLPPAVLAGLVLGMLAISQLAEWLIAQAGYGEVGNLAQFRRTLTGVGGRELLVSLVGLALLPGIAEELALRGLVQRGLEPRLGAAAAVGVSSLLFGALHGEPVHASGAFVLGIYLGTIVALSGSIRPAVLCHVVNNAMATLGVAFSAPDVIAWAVLAGALAGPWALWRTWLQARAAPPALGETPEPCAGSEGPSDPP